MIGLLIIHILNQIRLFIALKSNKTEKSNGWAVFAFLITSIVVMVGMAFFLIMQNYTILIEFLIAGLALLLNIIEFIMMIFGFISFSNMENSQ